MEEASRFEVTDHLELAGRGVFVVGHVRSGIFRIGMVVKSDTAEDILTISGIEGMKVNRLVKIRDGAIIFAHTGSISAKL